MRRVWGDATWGTLSSDGDSVFCVEGQPFAPSPNYNPDQGIPGEAKSGVSGGPRVACGVVTK